MALVETSYRDADALVPLGGWPARPATGLSLLWDRFQTWRARRETVRLLHSLDDRTLRDLDLTEREIESLVYSDIDDRTHHYDPEWWRNDRTA